MARKQQQKSFFFKNSMKKSGEVLPNRKQRLNIAARKPKKS
jgi:hypothetical protein